MSKTKEIKKKETIEILADDAAIVDIYQKVLSGKLRKFPSYTWELPNSLYYAKVVTQHLFEMILKWSKKDILNHFSEEFIRKYKLRGMKLALFHSFYDILENAYPSQFLPWELKKVPHNFWKSDDNKQMALTWLLEEKMEGDREFIRKNLTIDHFHDNGLGGLFYHYFENRTDKVFDFYYPKKEA
jgi:hypothetical protein